jgi:hypothetical protein
MSKRVLAALLFISVLAVPAHADFDSIANAIGAKRGVKRIWIPFLGVARLAVWIVSPKGVHDFQLATFEGGRNINPDELRAILRTNVEKGFAPLVQVWSKHSREWSFIYARPGKTPNRMQLLVLAYDGDDTTLVQVDVNPEVIARELNDPRHAAVKVARARED